MGEILFTIRNPREKFSLKIITSLLRTRGKAGELEKQISFLRNSLFLLATRTLPELRGGVVIVFSISFLFV